MTFLTLAKGMTHAENILKAAMADHHEPEQFIQNFKTLLPEGDADTFKKVFLYGLIITRTLS